MGDFNPDKKGYFTNLFQKVSTGIEKFALAQLETPVHALLEEEA